MATRFDADVLRTMRRMARRGDTVVSVYAIGRSLVGRPTSATWNRVREALWRLRDKGLVVEETTPWFALTRSTGAVRKGGR